MKVKTMKMNIYTTHGVSPVLLVSLLVSALVAGQALGADPWSPHTIGPSQAPAHLIIKRNPNLGVNVIVRLWIDGQSAGSIGYGHTYKGFLTPGHHILAVVASPAARWPVPWQLPVDVRSGQTYGFTAVTDGSGTLVLDGRFGFPPRVQ